MNRRSFFQGAVATFGAIALFSKIAKAEGRGGGSAAAPAAGAATAAPKLVDPKDALAKQSSYVNDAAEIKDAKLMVDKGGVKFKDQKCSNCILYQKDKETTVEGKKAAPCPMPFAAGKFVCEKGWCVSWVKKP